MLVGDEDDKGMFDIFKMILMTEVLVLIYPRLKMIYFLMLEFDLLTMEKKKKNWMMNENRLNQVMIKKVDDHWHP